MHFSFNDASGNPWTGVAPLINQRSSAGGGKVTVGANAIAGARAGGAILGATAGDVELAGLGVVTVVDGTANGAAATINSSQTVRAATAVHALGGSAPPALELDWCFAEFPPIVFSKPGISADVRVWGVYHEVANPSHHDIFQRVPDDLRWAPSESGVVTATGTGIKSAAPGTVNVTAWIGEHECGYWGDLGSLGTQDAAPRGVHVGTDLEGDWKATCTNGDTGGATFGPSPNYVTHGGMLRSGPWGISVVTELTLRGAERVNAFETSGMRFL